MMLSAKDIASLEGVTAKTVRRAIKALGLKADRIDYRSYGPGKTTRTRMFSGGSVDLIRKKLERNRETIEHVQKLWRRQRKIRKGRLPSWHERLGSVL